MVKVSLNRFISTRVTAIRNEGEAETRKLRKDTLRMLEEIFRVAARVARGRVKHQRVNGKMASISLNQRRRWFRVAEYVALTMKSIASNIDEKEIHAQLNQLERLVSEAQTLDQPRPRE
jgi:hypothetical protein